MRQPCIGPVGGVTEPRMRSAQAEPGPHQQLRRRAVAQHFLRAFKQRKRAVPRLLRDFGDRAQPGAEAARPAQAQREERRTLNDRVEQRRVGAMHPQRHQRLGQ